MQIIYCDKCGATYSELFNSSGWVVIMNRGGLPMRYLCGSCAPMR